MSAPTILNNIILNCLLFPNYASMLSLGLVMYIQVCAILK